MISDEFFVFSFNNIPPLSVPLRHVTVGEIIVSVDHQQISDFIQNNDAVLI